MTAIKPPETALSTTDFTGTGTIHNFTGSCITGSEVMERAARFGGADGLREFCRVETIVTPRTKVGAGSNCYHDSLQALKRINTMMTNTALTRPRRVAK